MMPVISPTDKQKKALESHVKTLTAGAGSGKTAVLTRRYSNSIKSEDEVHKVVAFTFTNKAANEMRSRVVEFVLEKMKESKDDAEYKSWWERERALRESRISTIHSFCSSILREYSLQVGLKPRFQVLEDDEASVRFSRGAMDSFWSDIIYSKGDIERDGVKIGRRDLVDLLMWKGNTKDLLENLCNGRDSIPADLWNYYEGDLGNIVETYKTEYGMEDEEGEKALFYLRIIRTFVRLLKMYILHYENELEKNGFIDFTGLQLKTLELLDDEEIAQKVRRSIETVLVDEFQDTDGLQWEIVKKISQDRSLFGVGDTKQSIYGFRGAEPDILNALRGEKGHHTMNENFRSLDAIVKMVNTTFKNKDMGTEYIEMEKEREDHGYSGRTGMVLVQKDLNEYEMLANHILKIHGNKDLEFEPRGDKQKGPRWRDIAILKRRMTDCKKLEMELGKKNIPYVVIGGRGFYQQDEIVDVFNVLSAIDDPNDDIAMMGALRSAFFGLSDIEILELLKADGNGIYRRIRGLEKKKIEHPFRSVLAHMERWRPLAPRMEVADVIRMMLDDTGARGAFSYSDRARQRQENLDKMTEIARNYERKEGGGLAGFVEYLGTMMDGVEKEGEAEINTEGEDAVRIMSVHKAKGLQFPVVYLPDLSSQLKVSQNYTLDAESGLNFKLSGGFSGFCDEGGRVALSIYEKPKKPDPGKRYIMDGCKEKSFQEGRRLLYVACTRAEDALFLFAKDTRTSGGVVNPTKNLLGLLLTDSKEIKKKENSEFISHVYHKLGLDEAIYLGVDEDSDMTHNRNGQGKDPIIPPREIREPRISGAGAGVKKMDFLLDKIEFTPSRIELNPTKYADLVKCPRLFHLRHRLELPWAGFGKVDEKLKIRPADRGNAYHEMFERIDEMEKGKESDFVANILKRHVSEDHPKIGDEARKMVMALAGARASGLDLEGSYKELEFSMKIGPGYFNGKMDLLTEEDELVHVIDYKTNVITEERTMESLMEEYGPQLELYAIAAGKMFGKDVRTSIFFTDTSELRSGALMNKEELKNIEMKVSTDLEKLIEGEMGGGDCGKCPVHTLCKKIEWGRIGGA